MPKTKGSPVRWTKELFIQAVEVHEDGCWFLPTNKTRAHLIAFRLYHGDVPVTQKKGTKMVSLCVCHKCDVPSCCNPDHLFLGTSSDNHIDMKQKNRHLNGEKNATAKLTEEDVVKIKACLAAGLSQYQTAAAFGVKQSQVSRIHRGLRWAHVK